MLEEKRPENSKAQSSVFAKLIIGLALLVATVVIVWCGKVFFETRFEKQTKSMTVVTMPESLPDRSQPPVQEIFAEDFTMPILEVLPASKPEPTPEPKSKADLVQEKPSDIEVFSGEPVLDKNIDSETEKAPEPTQEPKPQEALAEPAKLPEPEDTQKYAYIAIVIDDAGASPKRTQEVIDIKAPLTLAFLPDSKNLPELLNKATAAGHEIIVHVPMQPRVKASLEPNTLMVTMSDEEIEETFSKMLAKFDGFEIKGINNHMGSFLTESAAKLDVVMGILKKRGLFFLDSKTTPYSQVENVAKLEGVPSIARDIFMDNENNYSTIIKQLKKAENIALKRGYVVVIGHPKSQTSKALKDWASKLDTESIKMVHLSTLIKEKNKKN